VRQALRVILKTLKMQRQSFLDKEGTERDLLDIAVVAGAGAGAVDADVGEAAVNKVVAGWVCFEGDRKNEDTVGSVVASVAARTEDMLSSFVELAVQDTPLDRLAGQLGAAGILRLDMTVVDVVVVLEAAAAAAGNSENNPGIELLAVAVELVHQAELDTGTGIDTVLALLLVPGQDLLEQSVGQSREEVAGKNTSAKVERADNNSK
jgi:hypothetical protein